MIPVICLDNGKVYYYDARTPYEAMEKMRYYLNLKATDNDCVINKTETGKHLYIDHCGLTYVVTNK